MEAVLGFEFIENKIKVLELLAAQNLPQVSLIDEITLPAGCVKDGVVSDPKLVAEKIGAFLRERNITQKDAVLLVDPRLSFTRIVRLPSNLSDEQINLNLEAELNQYRQFLGKDAIISFNKLEEISEEGIKKINILFSAVFIAASRSYLNIFEAAGLNLIDIDVPILSLLRALDEVDLSSETLDVTLLILIQDKQLDMCILKGNRARFLHSQEIDASEFDQDKALFCERILSMVKLVVNFYQARFVQGEEIARIILNPLDPKFNQLHILLQEKLPGIPIQLSRPMAKACLEEKMQARALDLKFSFSCLLGAALRLQNKTGYYNLNLLFKEKTQRQNRSIQIYLASVALSAILAITIIMLGAIFLRTYILQLKVAHYASKLKQRPQDFAQAILAKERMDKLNRRFEEMRVVLSGFKDRGFFYNIASAIVLVPQDLWLLDVLMEQSATSLILNGEALTEKPIFDYVSALSQSGNFASVDLVSSKGHARGINFSIRCAIK